MTRHDFRIEIDMLDGNISRMCLTVDEEELCSMRDWAKRRIDRIFDFNQKRIRNESEEE